MTSRNEGFIRTETNHHEQEITHNMCSPTRRHTVVAARLAIPAECAMCEAEARAAAGGGRRRARARGAAPPCGQHGEPMRVDDFTSFKTFLTPMER